MTAAMTAPAMPRRRTRPAAMTAWQMLVWALRDQSGGSARSDLVPYDRAPQGRTATAVVAEIGAVGCRIDGGAHRGLSDRLHPDARTVIACLMRLPPDQREALTAAGEVGDRPERSDAIPVPGPTPADRRRDERWGVGHVGGRRVEYRVTVARDGWGMADHYAMLEPGDWHIDARGRCLRYRGERHRIPVLVCPLRWTPAQAYIDHANALADAVEAGLAALERALTTAPLRDHRLIEQGKKRH